MEKKMYSFIIEKDAHILTGNILPVFQGISKLESTGKDPFRSISIGISGYDDDPRELWEIVEVRKWYNKLINKMPYLFYYVENDNYKTEETIMLCLNDFSQAKQDGAEQIPVKLKVHQKSFRQMCSELRKFARQRGIRYRDVEDLIKEMSERYGIK